MDNWQFIRMPAIWPVLIGATVAQAAWHLIWLVNGRKVRHSGAVASLSSGVLGWAATSMMAVVWDGSPAYWLAFTVGLAITAAVQVFAVAGRIAESCSYRLMVLVTPRMLLA